MSPYIPHGRDLLSGGLMDPRNAGELNFLITDTILHYLKMKDGETGYSEYNEVMGVLTCVQHELYRKRIAKYEDIKCEKNGEVF